LDIADFAARSILPGIVDVTVELGPPALRDGVIRVFCTADLANLVQHWLDQQPLDPFETYLARASASPLLEALAVSPSPLAGEGRGGGLSGSERWVRVEVPADREAWARTLEDGRSDFDGVIVPLDPRLLDILRHPEDAIDRSDLMLAQG